MMVRALKIVFVSLALMLLSAQMACAAGDAVTGAGTGHSIHHAEEAHDVDGPCTDVCATHHLVIFPDLAGTQERSALPIRRALQPMAFSSIPAAPPVSPPRSVVV
ncbi:hypothetical protein [Oceanicaulis sp.]|uniref:hypothetical protein n=1 Tax=Oceanicaulis sp. TaxID=1924941 RepID=UPI003D2E1886